eukprot:scaffold272702_cov18-Tisochrysis_lutea.AAC.1
MKKVPRLLHGAPTQVAPHRSAAIVLGARPNSRNHLNTSDPIQAPPPPPSSRSWGSSLCAGGLTMLRGALMHVVCGTLAVAFSRTLVLKGARSNGWIPHPAGEASCTQSVKSAGRSSSMCAGWGMLGYAVALAAASAPRGGEPKAGPGLCAFVTGVPHSNRKGKASRHGRKSFLARSTADSSVQAHCWGLCTLEV